MRTRLLWLAGLTLTLMAGADLEARRVVAISPKCAAATQDPTVDFDGPRDMCVSTVAPTCAAGDALAIDQEGEQDRCGAQPSAAPPSCPKGYQERVRAGADECVLAEPPICPRAYHLQVRPGEDACIY